MRPLACVVLLVVSALSSVPFALTAQGQQQGLVAEVVALFKSVQSMLLRMVRRISLHGLPSFQNVAAGF